MKDAADAQEKDSEETIFSTALRLAPGPERAAYLERACAGRGELRRRVESLLQASPELGDFMEGFPREDSDEAASSPRTATVPPEGTVARIAQAMIADGFRSENPTPDEAAGARIGRYKLLQKLGEGGCGVVYMAEQEEPVRRRVALKLIKLGMDTKSVLARFEAERQALAMMDHPNIAKVLDGGATETGRPYFVMELVRGTKITDFCDRNRLSTRERLDLFIQVCQAVQHAHQKGLIHRDLKPSNILVTVRDPGAAGVPMIIDFGIAKATQGRLTDQTLFTAFEQFLGTPAYMSPEQAMMTTLDIDTRSDIYSLGVLLYELLTGRTPFDAKELLAAGFDEMRRTIREKEPPRPSTRLSTLLAAEQTAAAGLRHTEPPKLIQLVRGDLDWIVMKCLEKDRARRYETANALAMDLQRHLKNEPVAARPPSRVYELQKAVRRHKVVFAAGALVVLALALGLAASLWQAERARQAEGEQRYRAYVADMNLAQQAVTEGDLGRARSLLRTYVPKRGETDLRNWEWRYLANECRGDELFSLRGHQGEVRNVRFLDENTLLTAGAQDLRTMVWDLSNRRATMVITNENIGGGIGLVALAPKRRMIYYRTAWTGGGGVFKLDLRTGVSTRLFNMPFPVTSLDLSPNERILAIASGKQVELRDATTTNKIFAPIGMDGEIKAVSFSPDQRWLGAVDNQGRVVLRDLASEAIRATSIDPAPIAVANAQVVNPWWCRFSPDGQRFLSTSGSTRISVCNVPDGTLIKTFDDSAWARDGAFSADGKWLATVGEDTSIRLWDTATWELKDTLKGHTDPVVCVSFAPDGGRLASASRNGEVKVWSLDEKARRSESVDIKGSHSVGIARDGSAFWRVTGSEEIVRAEGNALRVTKGEMWSASSMSPLGTLEIQDLPIPFYSTYDIPSGGRTFVLGTANDTIHLRAIGDGNDIAKTHFRNLYKVAISLDGSTLAGLCLFPDWRIRVWRLPEMELIAERTDLPDAHHCFLSDDGKSLAILSGRGGITVLSMPTLEGPPPRKAVENVTAWTACAFSPDGRHLAASVGSGNTYIWDVATWHRRTLPRTLTRYESISFSRDGTRLVASDAQSANIFDTATGERVLALNLRGAQVAFTRHGNAMLAVSLDRANLLHSPPLEALRFDWLAESAEARDGHE